jgi:hypothetical protein
LIQRHKVRRNQGQKKIRTANPASQSFGLCRDDVAAINGAAINGAAINAV